MLESELVLLAVVFICLIVFVLPRLFRKHFAKTQLCACVMLSVSISLLALLGTSLAIAWILGSVVVLSNAIQEMKGVQVPKYKPIRKPSCEEIEEILR